LLSGSGLERAKVSWHCGGSERTKQLKKKEPVNT